MRREIVLALPLVLNVACSSFERTEIRACEERLVQNLKSPSSYKQVETYVWDDEISPEKLAGTYFGPNLLLHEKQLLDEMAGRSITIRHASIRYDADNSFGAAIRDTFYCNFVAVDGELYTPTAEYRAKWLEHIAEIAEGRPTTIVENADYREPPVAPGPDHDPFASGGLQLPPY